MQIGPNGWWGHGSVEAAGSPLGCPQSCTNWPRFNTQADDHTALIMPLLPETQQRQTSRVTSGQSVVKQICHGNPTPFDRYERGCRVVSGCACGNGAKRKSQSTGPRSMSPGVCEHPWHHLCVTDLLRGDSHPWQSLPQWLDEHRRWLLQKENAGNFLIPLSPQRLDQSSPHGMAFSTMPCPTRALRPSTRPDSDRNISAL